MFPTIHTIVGILLLTIMLLFAEEVTSVLIED